MAPTKATTEPALASALDAAGEAFEPEREAGAEPRVRRAPKHPRREIVLGGPSYVPNPTAPLTAESLFGRPLPLLIDIGAARARFFRNMAPLLPEAGFVGIEVRKKRVEAALERLAKDGIDSCRMVWGNALPIIEVRVPEASVAAFTILFPDPWPKKRHEKRRIFAQPQTAALLASRLAPGGLVMVKSDAHEYFEAIRATFGHVQGLVEVAEPEVQLPGFAPFSLDRPEETYYERKWKDEGRDIFRTAFRRLQL